MAKKMIVLLMAAAMVIGLLAGCASKAPAQPAPSAEPTQAPESKEPEEPEVVDPLEKGQTINVYSWWDPTKPGLEKLKEGFEEKYKEYNVTINFVKVSSYYKTMLTKLAGIKLAGSSDEKIDVMMLAFDKLPLFAQNQQLMPLDDYISAELLDSLYPSVKDGLYYDGTLYAVPRDVTSWCAYLNNAMFEEAGIAIPSEDWTMEDFINICGEFRANGKFGYATNDYTDVMSPWIYLYGGRYFDAEKNSSTLTDPETTAGIKALYHLMESDGAMTIAEAQEAGKSAEAFCRGDAAILFEGLSTSGTIEGTGVEYTVLPLPQGVNGHQSHSFTNCWTIPAVSSQPDWAAEVVKYFGGAEGQKIAAENDMGLPAVQDLDLTDWVAAKPFRQYYLDALGYPKTAPYPTHLNGANWSSNAQKLLTDKIWNVAGLTDEQLDTEIADINNQLTYFLMGGN